MGRRFIPRKNNQDILSEPLDAYLDQVAKWRVDGLAS
jgi:hypothetical protein